MKARRRAVLAPALVSVLLAVSACGEVGPGTASVVGEERITVADVDEATRALCATIEETNAAQGQGTVAPLAFVKQFVLGRLIQVSLQEQFVADRGVTPPGELVRQIEQSQAQGGRVLSDLERREVRAAVGLAQVAAEEAGTELSVQTLQPAIELGTRELEEWRADVDVATDARYAPDASGIPGTGGGGSVSQAVSGFAEDADVRLGTADDAAIADAAAELPRSQRCGG